MITYLYNENTPPFLARLFIQRFNVASNPAPAYVKGVATAFQSGLYTFDDGTGSGSSAATTTFGSGEYGDLAATIAAILLHPEARSPTVDADPASGSVRQPLIKVIAVLRALGLGKTSTNPNRVHRISRSISGMIGQGPHDYQTVLSHFLADFLSTGRDVSAGLYAPEEMVLDLPRITKLLNGLYGTMFSYGFNSRYGFGHAWSGVLSWTQDSDASGTEVTDELATLLTARRLSPENRAVVGDAYETKYATSTKRWQWQRLDDAKKHALELIKSSAEFHTNNIVTKSGKDRNAADETGAIGDGNETAYVDVEDPIPAQTNVTTSPSSSPSVPPSPSPTEREYKAVVFLNLAGGVDSFNMLVPHTCNGTEGDYPYQGQTLDEQYQSIRRNVALNKDDLHQIESSGDEENHGVHPSLGSLASLYDEGDALFVANAGYMSDPDFTKTVGHIAGHSSMSRYTAKVDAFSRYGDTGVLGRMRDVLISQAGVDKDKTSAISIDGGAPSLVGQGGRSPGPVSVGLEGVPEFPQ